MTQAKILDGKWLAELVLTDIASKVEKLTSSGKRPPGLAVILVGDNPASKTYVAGKHKSAKRCGFKTFDITLAVTASAEQVKQAILSCNENLEVDGILLQLPLPKQLQANPLLDLINPSKDADGLHPLNQGLLLRGEGKIRPCTPVGCMLLIDLAYSGVNVGQVATLSDIKPIDLSGKKAIVIGRSILVGKPAATLLLERNATVTVAHSKTADIASGCREADVVVAAVGIPEFVKGSWIKEGAVVIDVGINRLETGKLAGDIQFQEASARASAITPVPGGVGPMTVAMLMRNTLQAYHG
jgi:methylenetetrahydrofolate dehydrogenase (NADP+)/methenyltetrahydrofolate cyclohydrolase